MMRLSRVIVLLSLVWLVTTGAQADELERVLAAHPVRPSVTVFHVVKYGSSDAGVTVEWRGMFLSSGDNTLFMKIGPYQALVHTANIKVPMLKPGEPIRIIARVLQGGETPEVSALLIAPQKLRTTKGIGWNPDIVTPQEAAMVAHWYQWIMSFNRHLQPETAGKYAATVFRYSRPYRLDPRLVLSVVAAESAFEKDAVSKVGAVGLGQLMPDTAAQMGVVDIHDPVQNLQGAIRYLSIQMRRWQGRPDQLQRVLASYNAGEGAVEQYDGIPPYAETQAYVTYVLALYRELGAL